jgi:hypothetical protein
MAMKVVAYDIDKLPVASCVEFRYQRYANDPLWIPPFRRQLAWYYDPRFPFYRLPGNRSRHFVAMEQGSVAGHVSAMISAGPCPPDGGNVGLIGLFECDSEAVGTAVLTAAVDWLGGTGGVRRVLGPMNFDIWHEHRLKTAGFANAPYFGEPYNPPVYVGILKEAGFHQIRTWRSVLAGDPESIARIMAMHEQSETEVFAAGYRFETVDPDNERHVEDLHAVQMAAFRGAVAYTPMPLKDYRHLFTAYARMADVRYVTILRSPRGEVAGGAIAYPDPADAIRAMRGETSLVARFRFLIRRRRTHRAIFHFVGTMPAERKRQRGLGRALVHRVLRRIVEDGYRQTIFALIAEDSGARPFVGDTIDRVHGEYALYERFL